MGTQQSKLNKVVSRSTIDTNTSSDYQNRKCNHATSLNCSENCSSQLTDQGGSQLTGNSAGSRSRSNISSFLSSLLGGGTTANAEHPREPAKEENDRMLADLEEQKQQKKVNKNQKVAAKQLRKQQQQQQQASSPKVAPYHHPISTQQPMSSQQIQSPGASWPTMINPAHPPLQSLSSSAHSTAHLSISELQEQQQQRGPTRSRAMSANGVSPAGIAASSGPSQSSTSLPLSGMTAPPRTLNAIASVPLVPQDRSAPMASTAPQQLQTPPQSKPKKASFIRGRAGFAWLEKRLPQASMGMDDEILNNESWNYHDEGKLLDEMEIELAKGYVDRITDQHYLMKDVMGGNYHVPMDLTFKRVLENGCGAGDWTLDMASELPEADFVAIPQIMYTNPDADMSGATPSRPRGLLGADQSQQQGTDPGSSAATSKRAVATVRPSIRPRNCDFYPDVPINSLPYPDDSFDFVYQRRQCVVLLAKEWRPTVSELYRVLKPGGWVQILEPDLFLRGGGDLCQFAGRYTVGMFEGTGRSPNVIHELKPLLESAGFVNVEVKIFSIPLGWGGVIGQAMLVNQKQFVNEMEPIYVRQGHGTSAEYQGLIKTIFDEAVEKKAYINYHVVVGQKLDTSTPSFPEGFKMTMCETRKCDTSTPSLPEGFKMTMCETRKCDTSTPSLPEGFKMTMCETRKCDIIDTSNRIGDDSQVVVTLDGMTSKPQSEPTVVAADSSSPSSSSTPSSPRA